MTLPTINRDDLDPTLYQLGHLAGLLSPAGEQVQVNSTWFSSPLEGFKSALNDRPEAVLALIATLLGDSNPQVLGLPTPDSEGETWYPISDQDGNPTGLYLTARQDGADVVFGLAARWSTTSGPLTVNLWGQVPVLRSDGTAGGTSFVLVDGAAQSASPVKLAVEVTSSDRFGTPELSFRGVKLAGDVYFSATAPQVSFVFLDLQLPDGEPPSDRTLSDLSGIGAREWIEMAISLFVAQISADASAQVLAIQQHLLPILGLGAGTPSLAWEQIPSQGVAVFRDWWMSLLADQTQLTTWLEHWRDLLADAAGDNPLELEGSGTRLDPYRVGVELGASGLSLYFTLASTLNPDGSRSIYPGVWLSAPQATLSGTTALTFTANLEIAAVNLTNPPNGEPLPSLNAYLRLFDTAGPLVDHDFSGHPDLDPLGSFRLDELRAGLTLDADGRPAPMIYLVDLQCSLGNWPVLDLSAAEAALDGFAEAAGQLIHEQLNKVLGGDSASQHPGRHVAALLGLVPPTDPAAPAGWPVDLAVDPTNLTAFLGDPLAAIGCYHAACLETDAGGAPAWRFLLHDLVALLHHASVPAPALNGAGSPTDPWNLSLYSGPDGEASLLAWTESIGGRPQLLLALDLAPNSVPLGGGAELSLHQRTTWLHLDLPPSGDCPGGGASAEWMPGYQVEAEIASAVPIVLPAVAGLTLSVRSVALSAHWRRVQGLEWSVAVRDPRADWTLDNLQLPDLNFGTSSPFSWDLSSPDFGLGLDPGKLQALFRFVFGFNLLKWGGSTGFSLAGLLGWLPDLPNFSYPGLPAWSQGPFRLPLDWPVFEPPDWPAFFANPWSAIRLHLGDLFSNPRWAWPALNWLGGLFHLSLPDLSLPDLGWPSLGGEGGLNFPDLAFEVRGSGTYADPWAVTLYRASDQRWEALTWLDPDGPPSGEAIEVMLSLLPPALQNLDDLVGEEAFTYAQLIQILQQLSVVDLDLGEALEGVLPADLAAGFESLEQFLSGSDGAVVCVSQQPTEPTDEPPAEPWAWNDPDALEDLPEATHWDQLEAGAITAGIKSKIDEWSGADNLPVLLLCAPWESASAWDAVLGEFGAGGAPHFELMEFGTDPEQISLQDITAASRFYTAGLAAFNTAADVPPAERLIPISGEGSSQAGQVSRLVERIQELHPGKQVILVAHSTSGLAARAAVTADGDDSRVRGLITVGTPHIASPLPWQDDAATREVLATLARLDPSQIPDPMIRQAVGEILAWINAPTQGDSPQSLPPAPEHLFTTSAPLNLPAGVSGHALATRLPLAALRDQLLGWTQARLDELRDALNARGAPTHIGYGLRSRLPVIATGGVQVVSEMRLDIDRVPLGEADESGLPALPRLAQKFKISRQGGWLVGAPGANPRLRWAELGLAYSPAEVEPYVRLYDAHVDGTSRLHSGLEEIEAGVYELSAFARRALDEMMAALTRGAESVPAFDDLCALLEDAGLAMPVGGGYGLDPGGWDTLLAAPQAFLESQLRDALTDPETRADVLSQLMGTLGLEDFEDLLTVQPGESDALAVLRQVAAELGLVFAQNLGYTLNPGAWLALLSDPRAALQEAANDLLNDEARRTALVNELRSRLGLTDASPAGLYPLGDHLELRVTASGRVSLSIPAGQALKLGGALLIYGQVILDLGARTLEVVLKARPVHFDSAIAAVYRFEASSPEAGELVIQLHMGEGDLPAPYDPLDLHPLPGDFVARLGEMLPRRLLSTFAALLLESQLLENRPDAGPLLERLGLAYRRLPTADWQVRPLDGLWLDPVNWLLSTPALGLESGGMDPVRALSLVENARKTLGIPGATNTISLPYGLQLRGAAADGLRLELETAIPLALPGGGNLGASFNLTIASDAAVGVSGGAELHYPLPDLPDAPDLWDLLVVEVSYDGDGFAVELGTDSGTISLLPFAGWSAILLNMAAGVRKALPTMVAAALEALDLDDPGLASFLSDLESAAGTLQVDSVGGLQTLTANPVGWLQDRFSVADAPASAAALFDLLDGRLAGVSHDGSGVLTYQPAGSPVSVNLGRIGSIGARVTLDHLTLGPLETSLDASVSISDAPTPPVDIELDFSLAVFEGVIEPGGVSITPSLHLSTLSGLQFYLYPLGDTAGADFRLDFVPNLNFYCEGGALEDCMLELASRILVPLTLELFLDNGDVTGWLNDDLIDASPATRPGEILKNVGLLEDDGSGGFNLVPFDDPAFPTVEEAVRSSLGELLSVLQAALAGDPLVDLGDGDQEGGIYLARKVDEGAELFGLRLAMPDRQLSSDPEIVLSLGGEADWIEAAGGPAGLEGGISLYLVRKEGSELAFRLDFDLVDVGVDFSGKFDDPLFDLDGFSLGGVGARLYLSAEDITTSAAFSLGALLDLHEIGIPLGLGGGNAVAQSLLGGGEDGAQEGDSSAVNPSFSVRVGYVNGLYVDLHGQQPNEAWFPIQRSFGPVHVEQVGVRWTQSNYTLSILLDGGVTISGLAVGLDDLELKIPVKHATDLSKWSLGLKGLAIAYSGGGVRITGALRQVSEGDSVRYDGLCLVEVSGRTFVALGSYMKDPFTSLFVFVLLPITIGGPPYLFIIGLAGGFGYNRGLLVPGIGEVPDFPLVAAASGSETFSERPMDALVRLGDNVPPRLGSYWIAAGIRFTSFALIDSAAILYILLDRGLEIGLLGISQMELPPEAPLVSIEMALKVRFSTVEGVLSVEARLTDNSWLLTQECRLTGGFAFYLWFGGTYKGDFVVTMGGYHPRFPKPSHYPDVPRLGFNWRVSSTITIKGESYFALTPSSVMAGGLLEAVYKSGNLKAWFTAYAHFLIYWRPFAYDIEIGISIGVSYRLRVNLLFGTITKTFKVELGARVWIWGPELSGEVEVTWWVISFTFSFGAGDDKKSSDPIPWTEFRHQFLPADEDIYVGFAEKGLLEDKKDQPNPGWIFQPEFIIRVETSLGTNAIEVGSVLERGGYEIDIRPMHKNALHSRLIVSIRKDDGGQVRSRTGALTTEAADALQYEKVSGKLPSALWEYVDIEEDLSSRTVPSFVGVRLVADIDESQLKGTDQLAVKKIFDMGIYPLPFAKEIDERVVVSVDADIANLLDQASTFDSQRVLSATQQILGTGSWQMRRSQALHRLTELGYDAPANLNLNVSRAYLNRRRNAPPQIASLYEGMAADLVVDVPHTPIPPRPPVEVPKHALHPRLKSIMRVRPEPTRQADRAARTTVSGVEGATRLPRLLVVDVTRMPVANAALQRIGPPQANRATSLAARGTTFTHDNLATPAQRGEFTRLQERAVIARQMVGPESGEAEGPALLRRLARAAPTEEGEIGVTLQAGSTQVWELPVRNRVGELPTLFFAGDQALRVTCFNRGNSLLSDLEFVGQGEYSLPEGTARLALSGLGRASGREKVEPGMGAVTLHQATHPLAVTGWQGSSQLLQVGRSVLLGRGAVVRTGAPLVNRRLGIRTEQALVEASEALRGQTGVETYLPREVTVLGILVERRDQSAEDSLARDLGLDVRGASLSEQPLSVLGSTRALLLYDVLSVTEGALWIAVGVAARTGWRIDGVFGMSGEASQWATALAEQPLASLVENGPLTPTGQTRLVFSVDTLDAGGMNHE